MNSIVILSRGEGGSIHYQMDIDKQNAQCTQGRYKNTRWNCVPYTHGKSCQYNMPPPQSFSTSTHRKNTYTYMYTDTEVRFIPFWMISEFEWEYIWKWYKMKVTLVCWIYIYTTSTLKDGIYSPFTHCECAWESFIKTV